MQLEQLPLATDEEPLPAEVATFLANAQSRIDRWFARPEHQAGFGFIPSDYEQVWRALAAIRREHPDCRRLLEWGSGFGVVAGLGAILGMDAHGIEIDGELIPAATELLTEHDLTATMVQGSFVPMELAESGLDEMGLDDLETRTVLDQPDAYDDLGRNLDDFELVFAYPWPTEEELYLELFRRGADYGAILLTWSNLEGPRAHRKIAGDQVASTA